MQAFDINMKELISLELKLKFPSLNHRLTQRELTSIKNSCKIEIVEALRETGQLKKLKPCPMLVMLRYNYTHDADNSIYGAKFFNDALMDARVIPSDGNNLIKIVILAYDERLDFGTSVFHVLSF